MKKFAKARLEICTCKFGAYPQIQGEFHERPPTFTINNTALQHFVILNRSFSFSAFIKSNLPDKYPNLQIRYVQGRDPTIKLIDGSGEVKEVFMFLCAIDICFIASL